MAKNMNNVEGKTLEQLKKELIEVVEKHNLSESTSERVKLKVEADKLRNEYNKVAKLDAYAECLKAEKPMLAFVKMYKYNVVSVGIDKKTDTLSVKTEGNDGAKLTEVFNLWDFVEACEGMNKQVTAALDWKSKATKAQKTLIENVQKYIDDGAEKDVAGLKKALQEMFNSILMIPGESGNNAVIATSKQARLIYMTCGRMNSKNLQAMFGREKSWQSQAFAFLHCAVEAKDFTCIYGDDASTAAVEEDTEENTEE